MTPATTLDTELRRAEHDPDGLRAFHALRRRIVRQELAPGAPLREQTLAAEYGISRPRIRAVFASLEQRGLVQREPNRGAVVRRSTLAELLHLYDVREALEGMAARLATQNVRPESWQDLVELFGAPTEAAVESSDVETFLAHNECLRTRMLTACANPALTDALAPLYDRTSMSMRRLVLSTSRAREALGEHRAVLAAMRRGDADGAERQKRLNLQSARRALQRYHSFLL